MQSSFSVFQLFCFFFAISRYSPMLYLTSGWHKQVVKKTDNLQVSGEGENGKLQWKTCHDKSNLHGQSVMTSSRMKTNWMNDFRYYFQFHLFSSRSSLSSARRQFICIFAVDIWLAATLFVAIYKGSRLRGHTIPCTWCPFLAISWRPRISIFELYNRHIIHTTHVLSLMHYA